MKFLLPIVPIFVLAMPIRCSANAMLKVQSNVASIRISLGKINSLVQDKYVFMWLADKTNQCIEYLRLAYHGLRAKDKSFNASFKTDLDPAIGKINVAPQDIGRVMLNLINNAFYAVSQRKLNGSQNGEHLEPTVTLKSKQINARPDDPVGRNKVVVSVTDNGAGIPKTLLIKYFSHFLQQNRQARVPGLDYPSAMI